MLHSMPTWPRRIWAAVLALVVMASAHVSPEEEAHVAQLFKSMSDYMAAQQSLSFNFDTSFEAITKEDQKIAFVSSGTVTMKRPDKIRATRAGGFANVEL